MTITHTDAVISLALQADSPEVRAALAALMQSVDAAYGDEVAKRQARLQKTEALQYNHRELLMTRLAGFKHKLEDLKQKFKEVEGLLQKDLTEIQNILDLG